MRVKLWLDSGAFSAWTRGKVIDVEDYGLHCLSNGHLYAAYFNLDVIPGSPGATRTPSMTEVAAEAGWNNYQFLRRMGLDPIPVYHIGERRYWLERMVGEGATYIGLGGIAMERERGRRTWLDEVFGFLCGSKGYPAVKVHGLGVTTIPLIHHYPWFTSDSTSWVMGSKTGTCMIPYTNADGNYDFTRRPLSVRFAEPHAKMDGPLLDQGDHYRQLPDRIKHYVDSYLKKEGFDVDEVRTLYPVRCRVNLRYFNYCQNTHPHKPFRSNRTGFFNHQSATAQGSGDPSGEYRLVYANVPTRHYCRSLRDEGCDHQLLSYIDVRKKRSAHVEEFVQTGLFPKVNPSAKV